MHAGNRNQVSDFVHRFSIRSCYNLHLQFDIIIIQLMTSVVVSWQTYPITISFTERFFKLRPSTPYCYLFWSFGLYA